MLECGTIGVFVDTKEKMCSLLHQMNVTATLLCITITIMNCTTTYTAPTQTTTLLPLHLTLTHIISTVATVIPPSATSTNVTNASSSSAYIHCIAVFTAAGYNHDKYDSTHLNYHRLHFRCLLLLPPFPPLFRQHFVPPRPCCRSCHVSSQFWSAANHLAYDFTRSFTRYQ